MTQAVYYSNDPWCTVPEPEEMAAERRRREAEAPPREACPIKWGARTIDGHRHACGHRQGHLRRGLACECACGTVDDYTD